VKKMLYPIIGAVAAGILVAAFGAKIDPIIGANDHAYWGWALLGASVLGFLIGKSASR